MTPLHLGAGLCSTVIMSHASTISEGTKITTNEITFCLKVVFSNFVFFFFGSLTTPPYSDSVGIDCNMFHLLFCVFVSLTNLFSRTSSRF